MKSLVLNVRGISFTGLLKIECFIRDIVCEFQIASVDFVIIFYRILNNKVRAVKIIFSLSIFDSVYNEDNMIMSCHAPALSLKAI